MDQKLSDRKLLTGLFFRLLPYQVLLLIINAVNGIVDSLYASNAIGKAAMSARVCMHRSITSCMRQALFLSEAHRYFTEDISQGTEMLSTAVMM